MTGLTRGNLTPRANNLVAGMRFTGVFGQPDGFGSVLQAEVKQDGRLVLTLIYKMGFGDRGDQEHMWSIELDNEQRRALAELASSYEPTLVERYGADMA